MARSAAPRWGTRQRSGAGSRPRGWSSTAAARTRRGASCPRRRSPPERALQFNGGVLVAPPHRPPLPDGPFLVVGLARSGLAAAQLLAAVGADVRACDAGEVSDEVRAALTGLGVEVRA